MRPVILLLFAATAVHALEATASEGDLIFARSVYPMLKAKCLACHGEDPKKIKGGLRLDSREALLIGGDNGPSLVPGVPQRSPLFVAVTWSDPDLEMPPKENDRLDAKQIATLRRWIELGAPWVDHERRQSLAATAAAASGRVVLTSVGGQSSDWAARGYKPEDLWSFRPLMPVDIPATVAGRPVHGIDHLIDRRLAEREITALGAADRRTLIRRATYDLTGLPPTPEEVAAFLADERTDAWERLIERLLASPHYGEHWGTQWLDVVRYADSSGFANDYPRPHAWRYRDYVIRAFNDDKPYDRFIREQIAGDELSDDPEHLIATGFLRSGPWEHTSMSVAAVTRQLFLDDVTNSVGLTFLGHELRCAQCHDHKFDPIPTRDYYRIQAAFAPVQFAERPAAWLAHENTTDLATGRERLDRLIAKSGKVRGLETLPKTEWPVAEFDPDAAKRGQRRVNKKREEYLRFFRAAYEPYAHTVYTGPERTLGSADARWQVPAAAKRDGALPSVRILPGGSLEAAADVVTPGALAVVAALRAVDDPVAAVDLPQSRDGRRLALAEWMVSAQNPLTARVMVNRIWQGHFARGLAGNPNNFGAMGAKPTHPELLDWLAARFISSGWSIKSMHRLIMTSAAYRRSSAGLPADQAAKDTDGSSYARFLPRRMTAEEVRDSLLAVSGELNRTMGGVPARPELNLEVALQPRQVMGGVAMAYEPDPTPAQRHRRTIYTERIRTLRDPLLEVFNQPNLDISSERRDASTIAPQAFSLFNSEQVFDRAVALAVRLTAASAEPAEQVRAAFRLLYGRDAQDGELERCLHHLDQRTAAHQQMTITPPVRPTRVVRTMIDEETGVEFYWVEDLTIYRDRFVPDRHVSEVPPTTRALADLCLVLINSNEFLFLY